MSVTAPSTPSVLVVLVVHDGITWLPRTLDALLEQTYGPVDIVAVDNASEDGSRDLLLDRLGEDRVHVADRDLGFGAAVSMALDARPLDDAPLLLVLHDDCALEPDALARMVEAVEHDPRLAIVGPKLRRWDAPDRLESVGWTIDASGRAETGVDVDELDQGQHDEDRRALYVPTTAMLVRREVFEQLGRFDRRYHVFRDDLDLCWRAWMQGHDVETVPSAVGIHAAGAANYLRLGQTRFLGPRYFAERNTLATLLKNYGSRRLLPVVLLYLVVGLAKVLGFVLTRRFSDAYQTVRAWLWNVAHLGETWRLRRRVQRGRMRQDRDLQELFGRIGPRVRAYVEAMASWVAGGDVAIAPGDDDRVQQRPERPNALRRGAGLLVRRPVLVIGLALLAVGIAGTWQLFLPGELRGGELAPWPVSSAAFLGDYVAGWHEAGAFGTGQDPSPAQALLGLFQLLLGNSAYLASRLALLLPFAAAWLLALRAAQVYSRRRLPRVVAATAYVLSPPALAALLTGRIGALVTLAVLPGLVAGGITLARRRSAPDRAWRAVAGVALLGAVGGAFEPLLLLVIVVVGAIVTLIGLASTRDTAWRVALASRAGVAVLGPVALLAPWSLRILAADGPLTGTATEAAGDPLWAWLVMAPSLAGFPGILAGAGFVLAGVLGLLLGARRSFGLAAALWSAALAGAVGAWLLDRTLAATWAGLPLLITAAAFAGLLAFAFATGEAQLARHDFGWRQLAAIGTAGVVAVSIGVVVATLFTDDLERYRIDDPVLPSFVVAAAQEDGPFRVLALADRGDEVSWEVVDGRGPTMASTGVPVPAEAQGALEDTVRDLLAGVDPRAADRLGALGIRYVLVPEGAQSEALDTALLGQISLDPRPVATGRLLAVESWVPAAAVLPTEELAAIDRPEDVRDRLDITTLRADGPGRFVGTLPVTATIVLPDVDDGSWIAELSPRDTSGVSSRVTPEESTPMRFVDLPAGEVVLVHEGAAARGLAVTGQLLGVLLAISLALRPPSFARRHALVDEVPVSTASGPPTDPGAHERPAASSSPWSSGTRPDAGGGA
ncbi:MAG: glycosyltransferase family 2 protein [Nitriliruptoraceae bacterium]|nr:glycosyltransferase family 2 protein [Nitriliruptoraceae bacterium]